MNKRITLAKIYIAYILCIAIMPIVYIMDVLQQQKQVFSYAWKNVKHDMQSNNRYLKINLKVLDMS